MKKVFISIHSTQGSGEDKQSIEFMTEGVMRKADGEYILSYNDTQILDTKNSSVKTRLIARGDKKVIIERAGELNSKLVIEQGERVGCLYSIPQGDLMLGIYGKSIKNELTDTGGRISMTYTVDANMQYLSENTIQIDVKEVK